MKVLMAATAALSLCAMVAAHADAIYVYTGNPLKEIVGPDVGTAMAPPTVTLDFNGDNLVDWSAFQPDLGFISHDASDNPVTSGRQPTIWLTTDGSGAVTGWLISLYTFDSGTGDNEQGIVSANWPNYVQGFNFAYDDAVLWSADPSGPLFTIAGELPNAPGTWVSSGSIADFNFEYTPPSSIPEPNTLALMVLAALFFASTSCHDHGRRRGNLDHDVLT